MVESVELSELENVVVSLELAVSLAEVVRDVGTVIDAVLVTLSVTVLETVEVNVVDGVVISVGMLSTMHMIESCWFQPFGWSARVTVTVFTL